ncbi:hypothetical protein T265_04941 [Opisthorchis viverrini]|uniref:Exonuclease domain-containing protein n=1 Tax=Opisthorchis viverrini TaxID=6198 RepID=A0A074ZY16_OPIVI|nr:hypothetical protein T265_04941 [Opisthorchis viverrini]KER28185.1 hypothetical protein T265_04941 [Opisthorchis viverrini]
MHLISLRGYFFMFFAELMSNLAFNAVRRSALNSQKFKYFLVLDFEATCERNTKLRPAEIIEFPVVKLNSQTLLQEGVFHHYVRPVFHPELTDFCTELTGIIQDMVDNQPRLEEVLQLFDEWLVKEKLTGTENTFSFVTCGDWDLRTMLPSQCRELGIPVPHYFKQWINIKQTFQDVRGLFPHSLPHMLADLNLPLQGRHHSGIDDARNIATVLCQLIKLGAVPDITGSLS